MLWLHDLWRLEGGAAQVKGASNRQKQNRTEQNNLEN